MLAELGNKRNASITMLPFTDWMGSTTTATQRWSVFSNIWSEMEWKGVRFVC